MYKQSLNSIKLVIIPVDGVLFNLNKLRYNYCKNFAESKNLELSKLDFYKRLSNNYDMYDNLPFSNAINISSFATQIENDLKSYFEYHTLETKQGAQALFEGLKSKGIKIAVISTHKEEDARFYLNKSGLIKYCDLVVGVDNGIRPLPSNDLLKAIQSKYQLLSEDILVISSFTSLNKAAESLAYNIIYVKDFVNPTQYDIASSYKCVSDLYDVLNLVLFDKYDDASLYASVLGFSAKMTRGQLADRYNHLLSVYADDQEIISVVEKTYKDYCKRLNDSIPYVDYPSESLSISEDKREDITQQVQKSLLNDQKEVNDRFKEETVEMMVRQMADIKEEKKEEPIIQPVEEKQAEEELEITNSQLVSELFKETKNASRVEKKQEEINKDVKLTINKLRASLDQNMVDETGELLNPQMLESVTEEHSTPTFRIVSDQNVSDTIVVDPESLKEPIKKESHNIEDTIEVSDVTHEIEEIIEDDDDETFDHIETKHQSENKKSHSTSSRGFVDWLLDVALVVLINLLVCVLCAIIYIVFIKQGIISSSVVLKVVNYISLYINFTVNLLGNYLSKLINDAFVLALACTFIFNSLILIVLTTLVDLVRK